MEKVIVTGGAGFIGSNLAEKLAERYHVIILDNLYSGKPQNIEQLLKKSNVEFVEGTIMDLPLLNKLFSNVRYIFHHAALARVPFSVENPQITNEVNVGGTLNVLLAARENKVGKVVFASSSSIYGDATTLPEREDLLPNPLSPYSLTKLTGEYYCSIFNHIYGVSTVSLRYFNVYGPRQDPHSQYALVIPSFLYRVSHNLPPVIYGDGEQSRDFTFIEDIIQANILAAENNAEGTFNIGSGTNITINRLAETVIALLQKNIRPTYQEARAGDPRHTLADISKARTFGYEPKWKLEDGIKKVAPYYTRD
jgi:UDP-glucose 4-epimerase